MARVTEDQILAALKTVEDPDKTQDIVSLGMVSGLIVKDGNVGFAIEVDPQRGPQLEPLRQAAEAAVDNFPEFSLFPQCSQPTVPAAPGNRTRKPLRPTHRPKVQVPMVRMPKVHRPGPHKILKKPWCPA